MTSARYLPAMDVHQNNDEHEIKYYISKDRYPNDNSNDPYELFICPYQKDHKIQSKRWRIHLQKCKENYGGKTKPCVFNASHHIPEPEYEYHTSTCPDRNILRQEYETSDWTLATQVNHNPDWVEPDTGESWDDDLDDNAPEFVLDAKKGMPLALRPQENGYHDNNDGYYEEEYYDEEAGAEYNGDEYSGPTVEGVVYEGEEEVAGAVGGYISSVREEELIPEKPENWNDMSKTQKKNHRRKYERQRQRMAEEGVTEEDFQEEKDPLKWTEKEREVRLNQIKTDFPMANDKMNATRYDYTSLLNVVCQRLRINLPEYQPFGAVHGGFAFRCRVHQTWYEGKEFCSTKKDARHNAAKWALLGMDNPCENERVATKKAPIHPKLLRENAQQMREADEVGRCMKPRKAAPILRQPNLGGNNSVVRDESPSSTTASSADKMANYLQRMSMEEKQASAEAPAPSPGQAQPNSMEAYLRRQQAEENQMQQRPAQAPTQPPVQNNYNPMEAYLKRQQAEENQMQQRSAQATAQPRAQTNNNSMEAYLKRQQAEQNQMQQQQQQHQRQQAPAQPRGWRQPPSGPAWGQRPTQMPPQQQTRPPIQQQQQQPQSVRPRQPAAPAATRPWGGWGSQNQARAAPQAAQQQQMSSGADDFPSLGASSNMSQRGVPGGSARGGRGRGTTTMKW